MPINVDSSHQFTIAVFPDTQFYSEDVATGSATDNVYDAMAQFVANNSGSADLNIKQMMHVGDLVENPTVSGEWTVAKNAQSVMHSENIPSVFGVGNHDGDDLRQWTDFRQEFSNWWGEIDGWSNVVEAGTYIDGEPENHYVVQEIMGEQWIFVGVEMAPRDEVMNWADGLFSQYDHAALAEHTILNENGNFANSSVSSATSTNSGQDMYDGWLSSAENLRFTVNGHHFGTFDADRTETSSAGQTIKFMFHNYQNYPGDASTREDGGDGFMRLLRVDTDTWNIDAFTYSPYLGEFRTGSAEQFSWDTGYESSTTQPSGVTKHVRVNGSWQ